MKRHIHIWETRVSYYKGKPLYKECLTCRKRINLVSKAPRPLKRAIKYVTKK